MLTVTQPPGHCIISMSMPKKHSIYLGKALRRLARFRGGGSALPGLIVERVEPAFLKDVLGQLEHGVVIISGTNGKTTTTKMVAELLTAAGYKVFTNRTGSNFTRGVVSALLESIDNHGQLPYNIAVLELDEAHAVHFAKQVAPRISLFLNVMRDQLDRFGEIDHTAKLLAAVARETTETVILNRDDPLVRSIADTVGKRTDVRYFGAHTNLLSLFPSDDKLKTVTAKHQKSETPPQHANDVELAGFKHQTVAFHVGKKRYKTDVKLSGFYNFLNAAAALATATAVTPKTDVTHLLSALSNVTPAFGRGERGWHRKQPVEFVLVKNPSGFRLSLASARHQRSDKEAVMIAINDHYADGRDMSWLWDVDFGGLKDDGVQMVSGLRAYDMALRLQYDNVPVGSVEPTLARAFKQFLMNNAGKPMRIYCTYTCMLRLRALAAKQLKMERAL